MKRDFEQVADVGVFGSFLVGINPENQLFVGQLCVGAKQVVPNGKNVAKIGIGVRQYIMMVYPMHGGRYQYPTQYLLQTVWKLNIGMVKLRKRRR